MTSEKELERIAEESYPKQFEITKKTGLRGGDLMAITKIVAGVVDPTIAKQYLKDIKVKIGNVKFAELERGVKSKIGEGTRFEGLVNEMKKDQGLKKKILKKRK